MVGTRALVLVLDLLTAGLHLLCSGVVLHPDPAGHGFRWLGSGDEGEGQGKVCSETWFWGWEISSREDRSLLPGAANITWSSLTGVGQEQKLLHCSRSELGITWGQNSRERGGKCVRGCKQCLSRNGMAPIPPTYGMVWIDGDGPALSQGSD